MQAFVEYVAKGLVDHPEDVSVTTVDKNGMVLFELRVHPEDVGRVIGRRGATINAIRNLLQAGSARKGQRCTLDLVEDKPAA